MDLAKEEKYSDERKYFAILRLANYKYFFIQIKFETKFVTKLGFNK